MIVTAVKKKVGTRVSRTRTCFIDRLTYLRMIKISSRYMRSRSTDFYASPSPLLADWSYRRDPPSDSNWLAAKCRRQIGCRRIVSLALSVIIIMCTRTSIIRRNSKGNSVEFRAEAERMLREYSHEHQTSPTASPRVLFLNGSKGNTRETK